MTEHWTLITQALHLQAGIRQEPPATVGVFDTRSRLRRQDLGTLFVLVELMGDGPEHAQVARELVETVRQVYLGRRGSITRRLRTALQAVHRRLAELNRETPGTHWEAGVTAAVLLGDELYLAQAGPALAYLVQPGMLEHFPQDSPWLRTLPTEDSWLGTWLPLGRADEVVVHLDYRQVAPGYALLLTSPRLAQLLPPDELITLLDQAPDVIAKDLAAIASGQDFSALIVAFAEEEPVAEAAASPEPTPAAEPAGPGWIARTLAATWRGLVALGGAVAAVAGQTARILGGLLPARSEAGVLESLERRRRWLLAVAILIPILLGLLTVAMYWNARTDRESQFQQLLQAATQRQAAALSPAADPARARELLQAAMQDLDRALALQPENVVAQRMWRDVQASLERLEGIVRLGALRPIASLPGAPDAPHRLIVAQGRAYVLDRTTGAVYRVDLEGGTITQVLQPGETRGGLTVGRLVDMAWVEAGGAQQDDGIVVLDAAGQAWEIGALEGVLPLAVNEAGWQNPWLAGGYGGNFYVLDAGRGQIWKYVPTANGYTDPPIAWLEPDAGLKLDDVVDMAIDGAIYLLRANGRIEMLTAGRPRPFDQPDEFDLTEPVALFAAPPPDSVYLADTQRVLQLTVQGAFQRQLLPPEGTFRRLSALWVDEDGKRLYAVDAGVLVVGELP